MNPRRPVYMLLIGFVFVLLGAFLPFLMVMRIITSTFFLNFFSYIVSVVGLFLGIIGSAQFVSYHRKKSKDIYSPPESLDDHHKDW